MRETVTGVEDKIGARTPLNGTRETALEKDVISVAAQLALAIREGRFKDPAPLGNWLPPKLEIGFCLQTD